MFAKVTKEDLNELELFKSAFEKRFSSLKKLGLTRLENNKPIELSCLNMQFYTIDKPTKFKETKWQMLPQNGNLFLKTDINPNGITGLEDIARTYTISFNLFALTRPKFGRNWDNNCIAQFYGYGRSIEEILAKFENYMLTSNFSTLYL